MSAGRSVALIVFTIALVLGASPGFAEDKITLAVMPFEGSNLPPGDEGIPEVVQTLFEDSLFQTGKYTLIERAQLGQVLKEINYQQTGLCDIDCAVTIGEQLAAKYVALGTVGRLGTVYTVRTRIVDVEKAELLRSAKIICQNKGEIAMKTDLLAHNLVNFEAGERPLFIPTPTPIPSAQPVVVPPAGQPSGKPELDANRMLAQLDSPDPSLVRQAAKTLHRYHRGNPAIHDRVAEVLERDFNIKRKDNNHVDAMAWLCNILGASGNKKYMDVLYLVKKKARADKVEDYAKKNYKILKSIK